MFQPQFGCAAACGGSAVAGWVLASAGFCIARFLLLLRRPGRKVRVAVARGKIDVEGGLLDLASPAAGVVQQLLIKEGQSVQKGQGLAALGR